MPPPSRDRLSRPVDISTLFRGAARRVNLVVDEPGLTWTGLSENRAQNASPGSSGGGCSGSNRSNIGIHRASHMRGRNLRRSVLSGRENRTPARRGGRRRGTLLPSWYPRTPLRDITAIVRAIERQRARIHLHNDQPAEAHQVERNAPASSSSTQLEHEVGVSTPTATLAVDPQPSLASEMSKATDNIPNKQGTDSEFVTPQKKLLDSIEKVREVWLEEQQKQAKTPAAKKAEREKKVRTLMSMR